VWSGAVLRSHTVLSHSPEPLFMSESIQRQVTVDRGRETNKSMSRSEWLGRGRGVSTSSHAQMAFAIPRGADQFIIRSNLSVHEVYEVYT